MKVKVTTKKNVFRNEKNAKKVKILTRGKVYQAELIQTDNPIFTKMIVTVDTGEIYLFNREKIKSLFLDIQNIRSNKLESIFEN